jgi:hypothetical protein
MCVPICLWYRKDDQDATDASLVGKFAVNMCAWSNPLLLTNIAMIQKTQRQDRPAVTTYPATVGPSAGPAKGAMVKIANAVPRSLAFQISEIRALHYCQKLLRYPKLMEQTLS